MKKITPTINASIDSNTGNVSVEYSLFSPGIKLRQRSVSQTQIDVYDTANLPGVKVELEFDVIGPGNPFAVSGSFTLNSNLTLNAEKPYLDVVIYVYDDNQGKKRRGSGIVRHEDIDKD